MDLSHLDQPDAGKELARPAGAMTPSDSFKSYFHGKRDAIEQAMAPAIRRAFSADRVVKLLGVAALRTPKLMECSRNSVLTSVLSAAQLGLDPSGVNGECYLIPYGNTCQLIIGYRGLVKLARRNPEITMIESRCVYAGDEYEPVFGTETSIRHVPGQAHGDDDSKITHVYAIARLANGERVIEVMSRPQIDRIRAKGGPTWRDHYAEMARKTVTRRLCKHLPVADELHQALAIEDDPASAAEFVSSETPRTTDPNTNAAIADELEDE